MAVPVAVRDAVAVAVEVGVGLNAKVAVTVLVDVIATLQVTPEEESQPAQLPNV
jgi:hypothetical protein